MQIYFRNNQCHYLTLQPRQKNCIDMKIKKSSLIIILFLICFRLFSSEKDTLSVKTKRDTVLSDSIRYQANNIYYDATDTLLILWDKAKVRYHDSVLKADTIRIDFNKKQAITQGLSILKENKQSLIGRDIKFDIDKKKGLIKRGRSKFDKGYYYGEELRKIDEDIYDVDNGIFTTCDAKDPHFFIKGNKVRLYFKDKVVMRPVVFYVNHFPILALPFASFTLKRGRKTGILVPSPGYNKTDGKYLRNIAFYYAFKDYADYLISADVNEKTGWGAHFTTNYIKRYDYNGFANIYLKKKIYDPLRAKLEWHITAKHHHDFKEKRILDANIDFISSKNILEGIDNVTDRLNKKITSRLSYKMPLLGRTLLLYSSYTHDILNNIRNITLPSISYSLPSKPIYELLGGKDSESSNWYDNFSYSYSLKALHYGKIIGENPSLSEILYKVKKDTNSVYISQHNAGILNNGSLRYDKKFWGWLQYSASISDKLVLFDRDKNDKILQFGNSYGFNTALKFSLYGVKKIPGFFICGIRHIFTPAISYSLNPDFSRNKRFYSFSGIGVSSSKKSEKITLSTQNKWQLKIKTSEKEKKMNDFFSWNSSISYDKTKIHDKGFSQISHYFKLNTGSFKTKIFSFDFHPNFSVVQDPYKIKIKSTDYSKWKAGISNWTLNSVFKLKFSSNAKYIDYYPVPKMIWDERQLTRNTEQDSLMNYIESEESAKKWNLDFSLDYSTNKSRYKNKDFTASFRTDFKFNLTKNWFVSYNNYYDVKEKKIVSYTIAITRNLHCWKLIFRYTRQSDYWSYNFRIFNIKLPDTLKFKTSDNRRF